MYYRKTSLNYEMCFFSVQKMSKYDFENWYYSLEQKFSHTLSFYGTESSIAEANFDALRLTSSKMISETNLDARG